MIEHLSPWRFWQPNVNGQFYHRRVGCRLRGGYLLIVPNCTNIVQYRVPYFELQPQHYTLAFLALRPNLSKSFPGTALHILLIQSESFVPKGRLLSGTKHMPLSPGFVTSSTPFPRTSYHLKRSKHMLHGHCFDPFVVLWINQQKFHLSSHIRFDCKPVLLHQISKANVVNGARQSYRFDAFVHCRPFLSKTLKRSGLTLIHHIFFLHLLDARNCSFFQKGRHQCFSLCRESSICTMPIFLDNCCIRISLDFAYLAAKASRNWFIWHFVNAGYESSRIITFSSPNSSICPCGGYRRTKSRALVTDFVSKANTSGRWPLWE